MNYKRRAAAAFVGAALSAVLVVVFFSMAAQGKENWKYTWDDDFRTLIDICKIMGWLFAVIAAVDVIQGVVYSAAQEKNEEILEPPKTQQSERHPGTGNTVRCRFCNYLMSANASKCLHCGTPVSNAVCNQGTSRAYTPGYEKMNIEKRRVKTCLFCGEPMTEKQTFCGACGRRQD